MTEYSSSTLPPPFSRTLRSALGCLAYMTTFKVRLRVPPSTSSASGAGGASRQASTDSASASTKEATASPRSSEPGHDADMSVRSEMTYSSEDELADESMALDTTADTTTESPHTTKVKKATKQRRTAPPPGSISAVAATLTLEELDALPSAKRRKGLKTRGAPGPGRGWRKGLSKGQKPVYRLPDSGMSTADLPQNLAVHPSTPATFTKSASASGAGGGRSGATSTTNATSSSSSATAVPSKRSRQGTTNASNTTSPATSSSLASSSIKVAQNSPDAVFRYPAIPTSKDLPDILPLARIPNFIPAIVPLERSSGTKKPRAWHPGTREILSIGGRTWRTPVWLSEKQKGLSSSTPDQDTDSITDSPAPDPIAPSTSITASASPEGAATPSVSA